ncbi:MAG: hypothetical protein LN415_09825, partial [Candidatus Thermoplasmatota archaeon]|nr:hypothetical protein [Candidatus Thermoplasmatota archaeon]
MAPKVSKPRGKHKPAGRIPDWKREERIQDLLSLWFGRENVRLRNTEIVEEMERVHNVPRRTSQRYLDELVKEGLLENGELGYRPTDYYVEYSRAVPL